MSAAQHGFTLLELVVVIAIISTLGAVALSKLLVLQMQAERAAMASVLGSLRSAVGMEFAQRVTRYGGSAALDMQYANPMDYLTQRPENYLGVAESAVTAGREGVWFFDPQTRALIYRVRHRRYFSGGYGDPPQARFVVQVLYQDANGNGRRDGREGVVGVDIQPLEPYRWRS